VLVIIGIASAVVVPRLGGSMGNISLKTASKKIAASLRYARSQATSGGISYVAIFDLDKGKISIAPLPPKPEGTGEKDDGGDGEDSPKTVGYDLPDGVRLQKAISADGEVVSGLFEILFSPAGSSSGGDVILINDRGRRLRIGVDFITGSVKLGDIETRRRR
jgi:general secretion pathway protein H